MAVLDGQLTARELIHVALVTLLAVGVVYGFPNVNDPARPETWRQDR